MARQAGRCEPGWRDLLHATCVLVALQAPVSATGSATSDDRERRARALAALDESFRREIARLFPGQALVEVPLDHPVYRLIYDFPRGIPKIHEHDKKPAQGFGIFLDGRLAVFYSYQTDLGDGWEDPEVHRDSPDRREAALRMGVNLFAYAVGYGG